MVLPPPPPLLPLAFFAAAAGSFLAELAALATRRRSLIVVDEISAFFFFFISTQRTLHLRRRLSSLKSFVCGVSVYIYVRDERVQVLPTRATPVCANRRARTALLARIYIAAGIKYAEALEQHNMCARHGTWSLYETRWWYIYAEPLLRQRLYMLRKCAQEYYTSSARELPPWTVDCQSRESRPNADDFFFE
ncbi:unnamed protein product [Trichogramma brassicae]|uniref:Uncharacterized protein n=1 Tax=Trichogramma brassicae TaxID=86971 RepID=A0A6H5HY04_9HYME|nr:unnamed protein product [Trichogramma brassicae]